MVIVEMHVTHATRVSLSSLLPADAARRGEFQFPQSARARYHATGLWVRHDGDLKRQKVELDVESETLPIANEPAHFAEVQQVLGRKLVLGIG